MGINSIYIQKKEYYYYDTYDTGEEAYKVAKMKKKKDKKNQYYILETNEGFMFPTVRYRLYMTKVMRLI